MTAVKGLQEATITAVFAEQVRRRPDAPALRFRDEELSYAQLSARTQALAEQLRALGVGPDDVVGVCIERSLEMVIALVGILAAGAAYLPMHPDEPAERFRGMLVEAGARVLLTHERLAGRLPALDAEVLSLDRAPAATTAQATPTPVSTTPAPTRISADNLAYICYTSGSTGTPKGVAVPHRGVLRLVRDQWYAEFGPQETVLQLCALTFDPAAFEIWGALLNGGCLVIYPPGSLDLADLGECLKREAITTLWLTTGLFHRMVDSQLPALGGLRQLLAGGDVLSPAHVNRLHRAYPRLRLVNGYGPTENTCFTTCYSVTEPVGETVPIGRAIAGTQVYVLDEQLRPAPPGEWGLLYTSGSGLARGFANRPGITAERFLPDPFQPGERMYRVGDIVRLRADGELEFRGRADDQVKVGGYRVELGEIVATLAGLPRVKETTVVVRQDDPAEDKVLVAYVVPEGDPTELLPELRVALHHRLPRYMVPASIVLLDSFPLTRNGKVDRAALPPPAHAPRDVDADYEAPRTPTEALLADLWADGLAVDKVGVDDDFFELGGNSLVAADLLARLQSTLGVHIASARLFFENPTVAGLAALLDQGGGHSAAATSHVMTAGEEGR